jgi:ABC-type microcin C transport system permease subunit YejE
LKRFFLLGLFLFLLAHIVALAQSKIEDDKPFFLESSSDEAFFNLMVHREKSVLKKGDVKTFSFDGENKIYVFSRIINDEEIIVVFNNSDQNLQTEINKQKNKRPNPKKLGIHY